MFPYSLPVTRASLAPQLLGARLDDPVVADVERPVAPRTRSVVARALHAAADRIAPCRPVHVAH